MTSIIIIAIAFVLLIPLTVHAQSSGGSVIDIDKFQRQAEAAEKEKLRIEQDLKEAEDLRAKYLHADLECRSMDTLVSRINGGGWDTVSFLEITPDSYSPLIWITADKTNYDLELFYTNGESEKQFIKNNRSQHALYKSTDNKIESFKLSKSPYFDYESLIICPESIYQKIDIENRIIEVNQENAEQVKLEREQARLEREQAQYEAQEKLEKIGNKNGYATLVIESNTYWNAVILDGNQATNSFDGKGSATYDIPCGKINIISLNLQKQTDYGYIDIKLIQKGKVLNQASTTAQYGIASVASECLSVFGGGCLIATATYGSELAPEVQKLRELRDNSLLNTESGSNFMSTFNDVYYLFSPYIADYERENPVFKEMVKLFITPMITSLSILNYVEMNSEDEVLGYGISLIILNGMMYVGVPVLAVMRFRK